MSDLKFDGRPNDNRIGYFTYNVADDHWAWSDGMYDMHGYEPFVVPATTELTLQHKHPDDALRAFEVLETVIDNGRPFSCYHRIIDAKDVVRSVLSVGRGVFGANGKVEQVTGFLVDLTEVKPEVTAGETTLLRLAESRSLVDQAKGIVMLATGCDDRGAFRTLRKCATDRGLGVSKLAQQLVDAAAARPRPPDNASRAVHDLLGNLSQ